MQGDYRLHNNPSFPIKFVWRIQNLAIYFNKLLLKNYVVLRKVVESKI